ncbi:roadblock/LC7 domain-containing protein [Natronoglycomyces albus]|uniref:Roadblock/LC7 domain-containing protein n=1 Tax=Natronoglycomyces albus TaxID=2811108 RepID=A0A895XU13_9ACTN|nr:roadblock/LC7 domain-containing protein [Natronoglycomyces albus]QSB05740.1 roadblock/LC7 domain-containing protein [Natronoglycomyces albus]
MTTNNLGVYERSLSMLLASLVARTPGLSHAVLVSVDGLPLAVSTGLPEERAQQLAGIGSGLLSMGEGAGRAMQNGPAQQVVVEMAEGVLMAAPVGQEICLTLLAVTQCDREQLGYEVGQFTMQVGPLLQEALGSTGTLPRVVG